MIGAAVVAAGILIGLRALYQRLFDGEPGRFVHVAIYGGWSALALLLGALFWVRGQAG